MPTGTTYDRDPSMVGAPTSSFYALLDEARSWWPLALCRGDGADAWSLQRGDSRKRIVELRRICSACPVAGQCLRAGLAEPTVERLVGPVRVGLTSTSWRVVRRVVRDFAPATADDWETLAAWVLDEFDQIERLAEYETDAVLDGAFGGEFG